jgi:hypothetical protein
MQGEMFDFEAHGLTQENSPETRARWLLSDFANDVDLWPDLDLRRHWGYGIYCVMLSHEREVPHYIGKTKHVLKRMAQHTRDHVLGQPWRPVRWLGIPEALAIGLTWKLETRLILKYQPGGNNRGLSATSSVARQEKWAIDDIARAEDRAKYLTKRGLANV